MTSSSTPPASGKRSLSMAIIAATSRRPSTSSEDRRGGLIEFGHTLRIEDHMALLGGFPLQSVAATKGNDGRFLHDYTSRVVCQAALSVTV